MCRFHGGNTGLHGLEQIEFLVAGHAGTTPRSLAKVASGGELARIALAISVIASSATATPTLIFDEVDSGIGGGVAEVVGRLLKRLGQDRQVLCVTHLPQVASPAFSGQQRFACKWQDYFAHHASGRFSAGRRNCPYAGWTGNYGYYTQACA